MQVAEPLAVFGIGEVSIGPIVDPLVPVGEPPLAGEMVGEESGVDRLGMGPPQFHVVLVLFTWAPLHISVVEYTAELLVPPGFERPFEDLRSEQDQPLVAPQPPFLHEEPGGLDGVAGEDYPPDRLIDELAVRPDRLQHGLQVRLQEVILQFMNGVVNDLRVNWVIVNLSQGLR